MLLVTEGTLGTRTPPDEGLWVKNDAGVYYQCHDIGNIALMLPAAWLGKTFQDTGHRPDVDHPADPPPLARVGVALSYAVLGALGLFFLFRFFNCYYAPRTSFFLSLAFLTMTFVGAYFRAAWDVMGACCFVGIMLYYTADCQRGTNARRSALFACLALVAACSFRVSIGPFLLPSLAWCLYQSRDRLSWRDYGTCAVAFMVGMFPTLLYNYVRMGNPFRPATTAGIYVTAGTADLSGNVLEGLYGLLLTPNKGLVAFAPIFFLFTALPFVWRDVPIAARKAT